ncbi:hypothetical protein Pyn_29047 [Prunus yedoensis var. nudiflora]|uniref:Uncharacterized protein n=1 Tax=Prunus yedoensis var. nudiflora TaxID=2094558 RepID=A0A314Z3Z0_PRUYE|nr:hypothetical protein Pyn_29047 [Prunus yedoensis var. nudiflora]
MDQWVKGGLPPIRPPFHRRQPRRPNKVRTKELGEQNLENSSLRLDVEHVEKKATIEEDVEDKLRQPKMEMHAKIELK